jgi:acyl-coenzyme A thioesterase PaaI-like protein
VALPDPLEETASGRDAGPDSPSLQEALAPQSICFGCGPANPDGLRIASRRADSGLRTVFRPLPAHRAFEGVVSGGIIGTLIDCHANWTAAVALMDAHSPGELPSTVTARYEVQLLRPTPADAPLELTSEVTSLGADRAEVAVTVRSGGKVTATGKGLFVAVEPVHPAYHRW